MGPLALALVLSAQILGGQDQPLKNWKAQRREPNPRTGQMEIVALIEGDEAIPRSLVKDKEIVDITGLRLRYFTDPKKPEDKSEEVTLRSDKGHLDNEQGRIDLWGHVHIEKPLPENDGTVLEAPEATLFFKKKFVCPVHGGKEPAPGKCPVCGAELKSRTFSTVEAPKTFELTKPEPAAHMTGEGLSANDDLRKLRVERDGCLIMTGNPKDLRSSSAPAPSTRPAVTEMRSKGPMTMVEADDGQVTVASEKDVWIQRSEVTPEGNVLTTIKADAGELLARRGAGPSKEPQPERLTARGHVTMSRPDTVARSESLVWVGSKDYDVADLEGAVEVESGKNVIRSKTARIERLVGVSTFHEDVSAQLVRGSGEDAQPTHLKSRDLVLRAVPGGREVEEATATGDVVLDGLGAGAGEKGGRAEADLFYWNQAENHGLLEKRPFVRIVQEGSLLLAPRVVLEGTAMIVLKGPKQVVLTQAAPNGKTDHYFCTSDGDIVLDSSGERPVMRLQDNCVVRTPEVHLYSDRMTVTTTKESRELETLHAWGRVRARQLVRAPDAGDPKPPGQAESFRGGGTLIGEWLAYLPETKSHPASMKLTGSPLVSLDAGRKRSTQEQVLFYEKIDPETGEKVQVQEMRGGKRGVRIVVDDRPK